MWAISLGTVAGATAVACVSYLIRPMRPRPGLWDREVARELSHVGKQVFLNTLLMGLWLNLDRLTGLKMVSATELGYYTVAWNMAVMLERLVNRMCSVYFSMLAKTEDPEERRRWHEAMTRRLTRFLIPMLALVRDPGPLGHSHLYDPRYIALKPPWPV